jgi:hypothetical protein
MFFLCFVLSSPSSPSTCAPSCLTCVLPLAILSGSYSRARDPCPYEILQALLLLLPVSQSHAYLTSALLLMPHVPVDLLSVMATLLRSILVFLPVIVMYCIPGVLFLLPRKVVVLAACMMVAGVPLAFSAVVFFSLPHPPPLPYSALHPSKC